MGTICTSLGVGCPSSKPLSEGNMSSLVRSGRLQHWRRTQYIVLSVRETLINGVYGEHSSNMTR